MWIYCKYQKLCHHQELLNECNKILNICECERMKDELNFITYWCSLPFTIYVDKFVSNKLRLSEVTHKNVYWILIMLIKYDTYTYKTF